MKIFLSHAGTNKSLVREFRRHLPRFVHVWLDEESLTWGESLPKELKSAIESAVDFLIIFLDRDALASAWVERELEWAIARETEIGRTFVLPIVIGEAKNNLPEGFSDRKYLYLPDQEESSVHALAKDASTRLFQLVVKSWSSINLDASSDDASQDGPQGVPDLRGTWALCNVNEDGELAQLGPIQVTQTGKDVVGRHSHLESGKFFRYSGFISSGQVLLTFEEEGGEGYIIGSMVFRVDSLRKRMQGRSVYWRHDDNVLASDHFVAIRE